MISRSCTIICYNTELINSRHAEQNLRGVAFKYLFPLFRREKVLSKQIDATNMINTNGLQLPNASASGEH